ncbi:MAG: ATP-binding protein [Syntrophobacteraceae bacterium]
MKDLEVGAKLDSMDVVQDFVLREIEELIRSEESIQDIRLVLEEIFTNIAFYAYPDGEGTVRVTCFKGSDQTWCIAFQDTGIPFNPLEFHCPDLEQEFSERAIGGLGIHLVKQLAHEVHYRREAHFNVLTVCFRIK